MQSPTRKAFTLVELLVVIAIIGILASLLVVGAQKAREAASRASCKNNLKQIGLALHMYHNDLASFPPGYSSGSSDSGPGWGWAAFILPYVEQSAVSAQLNLSVSISDPANAAGRTQSISVFLCPSDQRVGTFTATGAGTPIAHASYVGMFGTSEITADPGAGEGIFYRNSRTRIGDILDGAANTLMVGERSSNLALATWTGAVPGASVPPRPGSPYGSEGPGVLVLGHTGEASEGHTPNSPVNHVDDFWSRHVQGVNFLFADGSVRTINDKIDPVVWQALGTRAGGEAVPGDY